MKEKLPLVLIGTILTLGLGIFLFKGKKKEKQITLPPKQKTNILETMRVITNFLSVVSTIQKQISK